MTTLDPTIDLVCYHWRRKKWIKSVGWFKSSERYVHELDRRYTWRTVLHYTDDINEAALNVRIEWVKIFALSRYHGLHGKSFRLEVVRNVET